MAIGFVDLSQGHERLVVFHQPPEKKTHTHEHGTKRSKICNKKTTENDAPNRYDVRTDFDTLLVLQEVYTAGENINRKYTQQANTYRGYQEPHGSGKTARAYTYTPWPSLGTRPSGILRVSSTCARGGGRWTAERFRQLEKRRQTYKKKTHPLANKYGDENKNGRGSPQHQARQQEQQPIEKGNKK